MPSKRNDVFQMKACLNIKNETIRFRYKMDKDLGAWLKEHVYTIPIHLSVHPATSIPEGRYTPFRELITQHSYPAYQANIDRYRSRQANHRLDTVMDVIRENGLASNRMNDIPWEDSGRTLRQFFNTPWFLLLGEALDGHEVDITFELGDMAVTKDIIQNYVANAGLIVKRLHERVPEILGLDRKKVVAACKVTLLEV